MDKLHYFLQNGVSVLELERLRAENDALKRKLELLKKALRKQKMAETESESTENVVLH